MRVNQVTDELNESLQELDRYIALNCNDWDSITDFLKKIDRKIYSSAKN
jgi:hypothetical protein